MIPINRKLNLKKCMFLSIKRTMLCFQQNNEEVKSNEPSLSILLFTFLKKITMSGIVNTF